MQWGSRIGVIMAVAGSAVGLGNFLRFPGKAVENGGGAFMIPYFVALLLVGIPLCWAEWAMGRYGGRRGFNSAPGIFSVLWRNPLSKYLGAFALLIPLAVYFYYIVVEAWCLSYAWSYIDGSLMQGRNPEGYKQFFTKLTGGEGDGALFDFANGIPKLLPFVAVAFLMNFALVYRGLSKGIEAFCNLAMPTMAVCAVCVLIRVMTLTPPEQAPDQTVWNGLGKMWNPDFGKLNDPATWLAAAGQIFFTLSVGFGVIINYASYVKPKQDIALSGLTASSVNEFFEVCLGGMITIPAAFVFMGASVLTSAYVGSSFSLGFNALPNVFAEMPGGQIFGFIWFFMLFLAAITSSLSMLQPVMAFFEEGLGVKRFGSTTLMFLLTVCGTGFVLYFTEGAKGLDSIDFWAGELFIVVLALIQCLVYGWVLGIDRGKAELDDGAQLRVPYFVHLVIKFVSPIFLIWILSTMLLSRAPDGSFKILQKFQDPVLATGFGIVVACILMLWVMVFFAGQRWNRDGRYARLEKE
jgi:neurotransmitter:Na+ symporter, NSS family